MDKSDQTYVSISTDDSPHIPMVYHKTWKRFWCAYFIAMAVLISYTVVLVYIYKYPSIVPVVLNPESLKLSAQPIDQTRQWDITRTIAWKQPLRTPVNDSIHARQSHTAICINFNWAPRAESLQAIVQLHAPMHRYITLTSPVPLSEIPYPLPLSVHYIQCKTESVVLGETTGSTPEGFGGALQHVCSAACFDYYKDYPVRGVISQGDDVFVNYTRLFNNPQQYPPNYSWAPPGTALFTSTKDLSMLVRYDPWWFAQPVANPYALDYSLKWLQANERYLQAYKIAFNDDLSSFSGKGIADFFYVPKQQLSAFAEIVQYLASSPEQYITVNDTRKDKNPGSTVTVRTGLIMSEWFAGTLVRLSAALNVVDRVSEKYPLITLTEKQAVYMWSAARDNVTHVRELCFDDPQVISVHPLKHSNKDFRSIYDQAYQ